MQIKGKIIVKQSDDTWNKVGKIKMVFMDHKGNELVYFISDVRGLRPGDIIELKVPSIEYTDE